MLKIGRSVCLAALVVAPAATWSTAASAQATRTWVSGVGDDANPCSRTAPCKTFAGAISKTAAGGEINCIDPGGFGALTITKSITIDCKSTESGVLSSGTNGIVVSAASTDKVVLRGLDFFGVNLATSGVRVNSAASVSIEESQIRGFANAVSFGPSGASFLYISNVTITNNTNGVLVQPTGAGNAHVTIVDSRIFHNAGFGVSVDTTSNTGNGLALMMNRVEVSGNTGNGVNGITASSVPVIIQLRDSTISYSGGSGINANGANVRFRVGNSQIFGNGLTSGAGVTILGGATVNTYLDNYLDGNASDGAFTSPNIPKK